MTVRHWGDPLLEATVTAPQFRTSSARVLEVIDGDTAKFAIQLRKTRGKDADLGFHVHREAGVETVHETIRFLGINAAEHGTPDGDAATSWLETILFPDLMCTLHTLLVAGHEAQEKYGRYLGTVILRDGTDVNHLAVTAGHAQPWDGKGVRPT